MELYYPKDQVNIICLLIYEVDKVDKCHHFGTSIEQKKLLDIYICTFQKIVHSLKNIYFAVMADVNFKTENLHQKHC